MPSPLRNCAFLSTGNALLQGNLTKWRRSAYSFHRLLQTTISSNRCRPQFAPICQPATLVSFSPQVRLPLRCPNGHEQSTECIFAYRQRDPMVLVNTPLSGHYPSSASGTVRWRSCLPATYIVYRTSTVSQDEIESPVTSCQLSLWSYFPGLWVLSMTSSCLG